MNCERCGHREATVSPVIIVDDTAETPHLCEACWQLRLAEVETAAWSRVRVDPDATLRQMEANLGRPLTPAERSAAEELLRTPPSRQAGPQDVGGG